MGNSCYNCGNYVRETESWEMPHIYWYECAAAPGMANLRSWPFHNTKCKHFVERERPVRYLILEA